MVDKKVSIIVPCYNHEAFIELRIQSILNQSYSNFELIILDDASTDNSFNIINKYKHHEKVSIIISNEINSGTPYCQWIKGVQLSCGDYIWIAESDDFSDTYFLESMVKLLNTNDDIAFSFCKSKFVDSKNVIINQKYNNWFSELDIFNIKIWPASTFLENHLIHKCLIPNVSSVLFRRNKLSQVIKYISNFKYYGDWYLYQLLSTSNSVSYTSKELNFFRKLDISHSSQAISITHISERLLLHKNLLKVKNLQKDNVHPLTNHLYHFIKQMYKLKMLSLNQALHLYLVLLTNDKFNLKRLISFYLNSKWK